VKSAIIPVVFDFGMLYQFLSANTGSPGTFQYRNNPVIKPYRICMILSPLSVFSCPSFLFNLAFLRLDEILLPKRNQVGFALRIHDQSRVYFETMRSVLLI
jgi:hypothetical protein